MALAGVAALVTLPRVACARASDGAAVEGGKAPSSITQVWIAYALIQPLVMEAPEIYAPARAVVRLRL
jgi:hypothetical protein